MRCPNCGSEMIVHEGLWKVYYCSAECGACVEDLNLGGGARLLTRLDDRVPLVARAKGAASEETLVARAQSGDQIAFAELVARSASQLLGAVYSITRDRETAEDVRQETLLRAWQNIDRFEGRSAFSTWLVRIGINQAYGRFRHASKPSFDPADPAIARHPDPRPRPDELVEARDLLVAIWRSLNELAAPHRRAVTLRDIQGLRNREAAELAQVGERAFKSRLHRGRRALRSRVRDCLAHAPAPDLSL